MICILQFGLELGLRIRDLIIHTYIHTYRIRDLIIRRTRKERITRTTRRDFKKLRLKKDSRRVGIDTITRKQSNLGRTRGWNDFFSVGLEFRARVRSCM